MKKPTPDTTRVPTPIVIYLLHNLGEGLHRSGFQWQLAKVCVPQRQYLLKSDLQREVKEVLESALGVSVSNTVSVCLRRSLAFPCLCSFPPNPPPVSSPWLAFTQSQSVTRPGDALCRLSHISISRDTLPIHVILQIKRRR